MTIVGSEDVVVMHDIKWDTYCSLNDENAFPPTRMSFFEGTLEITTVSARHENWERKIDFLVRTLSIARRLDCEGFGSVTMRRKDLLAGLEADACFYFGPMAAAMRGRAELDLRHDPAPELAVEVDVGRHSAPKLPLCAALGIGEIWRYHQDQIFIYALSDSGYTEVNQSAVLPGITRSQLTHLMEAANSPPLHDWEERIRATARKP